MTGSLAEARAHVVAARARGCKVLLLFDFDGTLAPIVEHPSLAQLPPHTRTLLTRLADLPGVHVGILSGRALADLEAKVQLPHLIYGGTAGLELKVDGQEVHHVLSAEERLALDQAEEALRGLAARYPGAWVEHKPAGMTLHYREVSHEDAARIHDEGREVLRRWPGRFQVMDGPRAVEAILAVGRDKGESVRWVIAHLGSPVFPVCVGDSDNDRPSLAVANQMGGLALGVGKHAPPEAGYHLADPPALVDWLDSLLPELGGESISSSPLAPFRGRGVGGEGDKPSETQPPHPNPSPPKRGRGA